jgi:CheY-like chemotaxis protein
VARARDRRRRRRGRAHATPPELRIDAAAASAGDLVLVATQDPALRRQLCNKLDDHGYRVVVAEAVTRIDEVAALTRPLVILLDLDGVDPEGFAVLGRIRERLAIPVIALSTRATEGDKVAALDAQLDAASYGRHARAAMVTALMKHPDRHDDHGKPSELEPPLDRCGGLVMQDPLVPALPLEDQLAGEEHRPWEPQRDFAAQVVELGHRVGSDRMIAVGRPAQVCARERDVPVEISLELGVERVDLIAALEHAGVDDPRRHEHDLFELARKHARDLEDSVEPEPTIATRKHDGGWPLGIQHLRRGRDVRRRDIEL